MALKKVADPYTSLSSDGDHVEEPFLDENSANKDENGRTIRNNDSDNKNNVVQSDQNSNPKKEPSPQETEGEPLTVLMTVPPDGGWGWVVVTASFIANFIVDGIIYCYGIFSPLIKQDFNEEPAKVAMPGSLLAGFYLMTGPFVSVLANKYGFQKVVVGGSILAAAAFALSSIAMNVDFLIFSYGILGGIGFGMIYSPSIVTVGYYFERWRGIATGIAVCGSGIGTFTLSPLNEVFIAAVGWKNTFLIQAGIILICGLCGMTFRPIKPVKVAVNENLDENEEGKPEEPLKSRQSLPEPNNRSGSIISLKSKPPTAAEILQIAGRPTSSDTTTTKLSKSSQSLNVNNAIIGYNEDVEKNEKRLSVPNFEEDGLGPMGLPRQKKERSMSQVTDPSKGLAGRRKRTISEISSTLSLGQSVECVIRSRRGTITQVDEKVAVPLSRDDAYFSGSLTRLPQYKLEDSLSYTLSVTRIPQKKEPSRMSPSAIWKVISDLFDFSLLLSPSFNLLLLSGLLTMIGYFTPFNYLKDRAISEGGWSQEQTVWLLSTVGITNTVGRVISGLVAGFPGMDATFMNNIALLIAGITTMISGISLSIPYQYAYCAIFGLSTATFASLRSIMVVDLLGLENLNNAFGILLFVQGFGTALGTPLSGLVYEATDNYEASFYFSGTLIMLSGLILFPLKAINRWEKRKRSKSTLQNAKKPNCT